MEIPIEKLETVFEKLGAYLTGKIGVRLYEEIEETSNPELKKLIQLVAKIPGKIEGKHLYHQHKDTIDAAARSLINKITLNNDGSIRKKDGKMEIKDEHIINVIENVKSQIQRSYDPPPPKIK